VPVIFEYVPKDTGIHRLNPIVKILMLVVLFTMLSIYWDLRFLLLLTFLSTLLYVLSKTPAKWMLLSIPFCIIKFFEASLLGIMQSNPELFKTLPTDVASTIIARFGPFTLTYGGLLWTLAVILKIVNTMMLTFMFIHTTSLNDLIRALSTLKIPPKIIYVFIITLRFVPDMWRELKMLINAQRLKGWNIKVRNPIKLLKMTRMIVGAFIRKVILHVEILSIALQIRGFSLNATRYPWKIKLTSADKILMVLMVLVLVVATYLYFTLDLGKI